MRKVHVLPRRAASGSGDRDYHDSSAVCRQQPVVWSGRCSVQTTLQADRHCVSGNRHGTLLGAAAQSRHVCGLHGRVAVLALGCLLGLGGFETLARPASRPGSQPGSQTVSCTTRPAGGGGGKNLHQHILSARWVNETFVGRGALLTLGCAGIWPSHLRDSCRAANGLYARCLIKTSNFGSVRGLRGTALGVFGFEGYEVRTRR